MSRRNERGAARWLWISMLAAGCAGEELETTAATGAELMGHDVLVDADTAEANTVVQIGNCTGTLITPRIVLTANHCITGYEGEDTCRTPDTSKTVAVGPNKVNGPKYPTAAILSRHDECQDNAASDLAILYLQTPVTQSTMKGRGAIGPLPTAPRIIRPSLVPPGSAEYGVAGYSTLNYRQVKYFYSGGLENSNEGMNNYWEINEGDWEVGAGDSGGPLFVNRPGPGGERDVIGVLFGRDWADDMQWADITQAGNRQFLLDHIKNRNVPAGLGRSDEWLAQHGQDGETFWGEVGYQGPCQPVTDGDCDNWGGSTDNCPTMANSDQLDWDNDGIGDVCDWFPWGGDDPDGDGLAGLPPSSPAAYKGDNCPYIYNPDQANCNLLSEQAENTEGRSPGTEVLGDACDPVPCPAPAIGWSRDEPFSEFGTPTTGGYRGGRVISEFVTVTKVPPHKKTNLFSTNPVAVALGGVQTGARFCQQNVAFGYDCHAPENLRDTHFNYAATREGEVLDPAHPWHRVTLDWDTSGSNWTWPFNGSTSSQLWSYHYDWGRWRNADVIPPASDAYRVKCENVAAAGEGTCLDGTLWYHAISEVGRTVSKVALTKVGLHLNGSGVGADNMPNGFLDIRPDAAYVKSYAGTGLMRKYIFPIPTGDPAPYEDVVRTRIRPLVAEALGSPVHVAEDSGGSYLAGDMLSESLQAALANEGTTWLAAAEPPGVTASLDGRIQAIAIDALGTTVTDAAHLEAGALALMSERGLQLGSIDAGWSPAERDGWVGTFSRSLGGVVIAGGTSRETGEPRRDVSLWRLGIGWAEVPIQVELQSPAAIVYSPADQKLWILDRLGPDAAEIFRVDPFTGATESLGRWQRDDGVWDRHYLSVDRDGGVLLTATSRAQARSQVARLRFDQGSGEAYAERLDRELPYMASAPMVDAYEYGYIEADESGALTAVTRRPELAGDYALLDWMFR